MSRILPAFLLAGPATIFEFSTARKCPTKFIGNLAMVRRLRPRRRISNHSILYSGGIVILLIVAPPPAGLLLLSYRTWFRRISPTAATRIPAGNVSGVAATVHGGGGGTDVVPVRTWLLSPWSWRSGGSMCRGATFRRQGRRLVDGSGGRSSAM